MHRLTWARRKYGTCWTVSSKSWMNGVLVSNTEHPVKNRPFAHKIDIFNYLAQAIDWIKSIAGNWETRTQEALIFPIWITNIIHILVESQIVLASIHLNLIPDFIIWKWSTNQDICELSTLLYTSARKRIADVLSKLVWFLRATALQYTSETHDVVSTCSNIWILFWWRLISNKQKYSLSHHFWIVLLEYLQFKYFAGQKNNNNMNCL